MSGPPFIANARMYSVAPAAAAAWRRLFEQVASAADVPLDIIDHAYPAPLDALWDRDDLGTAFICGWPFAKKAERPKIVAAPVPAGARYGGQPIYFTDLVVRADSPFTALPDTFGHRLGYTAAGSHSGFNALRYHLASRYPGGRPYDRWVGPLITPRKVVEAVLAGDADIGPLDSFAHDLLRRHEPALMTGIRLLESTDPTPVPPLIASRATPDETIERLRAALLSVGVQRELAGLREDLCLAGFALPVSGNYEVTLDRAKAGEAAGYGDPQ
jgi:ABC-type phosphate/phosphonate transport system substrate-binding protein